MKAQGRLAAADDTASSMQRLISTGATLAFVAAPHLLAAAAPLQPQQPGLHVVVAGLAHTQASFLLSWLKAMCQLAHSVTALASELPSLAEQQEALAAALRPDVLQAWLQSTAEAATRYDAGALRRAALRCTPPRGAATLAAFQPQPRTYTPTTAGMPSRRLVGITWISSHPPGICQAHLCPDRHPPLLPWGPSFPL